jgi:urate oxidase
MLAGTAYGKSDVRLVKVTRHGDRDDLIDLTVAVRFEGDYDESYTNGDNHGVLPTDTMKNTVYALAASAPVQSPEEFGLRLCRHFMERNGRLSRIRIDLSEQAWGRIVVGAREHGQAFARDGGATRTAAVQQDRSKVRVGAGVTDLVILKSAKSAFSGFMRDEYTTLPDTSDRLLATSLTATWQYWDGDVEYGQTWRAIRTTLLEAFADHDSRSVQHTLHAMAQSVLDNIDAVTAVHLVMPNKHHLPIDLSRLGLQNRNEIFVPTAEPYGLIEATLVRGEGELTKPAMVTGRTHAVGEAGR